ncbi:MAG: hypothetical protein R6U98_11725 [Pirellulaceae bacterium]
MSDILTLRLAVICRSKFIAAMFLALGLVVCIHPAGAATVLDFDDTNFRGSRPITAHVRIVLADDALRIDRWTRDPSRPSDTLLFRLEAKALFLVDHRRREAIRIDTGELDDIERQQREMLAELERQLEALPAEQRELAESIMRERGYILDPETGSLHPRPRATGEATEFAGVPCELLESEPGDATTRGACLADWQSLELTADQIDVARAFSEVARRLGFLHENYPMFSGSQGGSGEAADQKTGLALRIRYSEDKGMVREVVFTELSHEDTSPAIFLPPANYDVKTENILAD